ncbi:MAG: hypothetical protein U1E22_03860, partial [Coriobacteriia bacterium]|nr:hypothetical protein [Coriobacteriia bacterium]
QTSVLGAHVLEYYATDAAGNAGLTRNAAFLVEPVDEYPPVTTSDAPTHWVTGPVAVTLSATDDVTGVANTYYRLDGSQTTTYTAPVAISAEGTHTVEYWSVDSAGNTETRRNATARIDGTAPVTTDDAVASYIGTATITLTATDGALSGVSSVKWRLDAGAWQTGTSVQTSVLGAHVLEYYATDAAGNAGLTRNAAFKVFDRNEDTGSLIYYSGTWSTTNNPALSAGAYKFTVTSGSYALVSFTGTEFHWLTTKAPAYGIARVTLDGGAPVDVDLYNPSLYKYKQDVWNVSGLSDTLHTVKIEYTGAKNAASSGFSIGIDALDVVGALAPTRYEETNGRSYLAGTWSTTANSSLSAGSYKYTVTAGSYAIVSFTGTEVRWITTKAPAYGIARVTLDGGAPVDVDLYNPSSYKYKQNVWSRTGLANTEHTVRIEYLGTKNAASSGFSIGIDALDVVGVLWPTRYQQGDPKFYYEGNWTTTTSSSLSGGSYASASTAGAYALVSFTGTEFHWLTTKAPAYGIARVTLDGGTPVNVDLYNPSVYRHQTDVWNVSGLSDTLHTVKIEYTGAKNAASSGYSIGVDALDVVGILSPTRYQQSDSKIYYSGAWSTSNNAALSGGSYLWTQASGSHAVVRFTGTEFHWITTKAPAYGIARVTLDGGTPVNVDLYNPSVYRHQVDVWNVTGLANTDHTLLIEYTGTKTTASSGLAIGIDAEDAVGVLRQSGPIGPVLTRYEQTAPSVAATGTWETVYSSSLSAGSYMRTDTAATATVTFTGSEFHIITTKAPAYGVATVSIDGGAPMDVDLYASAYAHQASVWSATGLANAQHTVVFAWTGRRNPLSTGTSIGLDAFNVAGAMP